ncbi:phage head completion protein [Limosilactobacillus caecicola]|uniref:phage head completion protein n=1 Tax=Limosilactobacillus caecicola TaxID=2941332 RepID=UPI00203B75F1|nr:head-tail adaptor protein [Limosilactobacillus caecicola]
MKIKNMTERITFYSVDPGVDPETRQPTDASPVEEFSCWAEVPKLPIREFVNNGSQVGFRKESPTFLVAFKLPKVIQPNWLIKWRDKWYEITGMDPDYKTRDLSKISTQEVVHDGGNG